MASVPTGFCEPPFSLTLASGQPDTIVRFTLDGSLPTATHGQLYQSPIPITDTTIVRAVTLIPDHPPSAILTRTYVFLDQLVAALDPRAFPESGLATQALTALPWLSVSGDPEALFGDDGLYANPERTGPDSALPIHADWWNDPGGVFAIDGGLRIHGGAARQHVKRPLRLHFRSRYGASRLQHPLFPDSPADEFDQLVLRAGGQDAWTEAQRAVEGSLAFHATYLRDAFVRRSQHAMGFQATPHGRFCHLLLNGRYWGVYNIQERPRAAHFSATRGGSDDSWDVMSAGGPFQGGNQRARVVDGNDQAWQTLQSLTTPRSP